MYIEVKCIVDVLSLIALKMSPKRYFDLMLKYKAFVNTGTETEQWGVSFILIE